MFNQMATFFLSDDVLSIITLISGIGIKVWGPLSMNQFISIAQSCECTAESKIRILMENQYVVSFELKYHLRFYLCKPQCSLEITLHNLYFRIQWKINSNWLNIVRNQSLVEAFYMQEIILTINFRYETSWSYCRECFSHIFSLLK